MASERKLLAVSQPFVADGTANGVVTVSTARGFKVKAAVTLASNTQPQVRLEVKSVVGPSTVILGPFGPDMGTRADVSAYKVSDGATITQPLQERRSIGPGEMDRATYEEEPTVARRVTLIDEYGNLVDANNPLPVTSDPPPTPLTAQAPATITSTALTTIFTFTSPSDTMKLSYVEVTVDESSLIVMTIDGTIIRELRTSPLKRNAMFQFYLARPLAKGQVLTVQAQVDRFIVPTYNAFTSMEGYTT